MLDVNGTAELPLALGLLDLGVGVDVDSQAIFVEGHSLSVERHLVVGEAVGGGAVAVVDLQLASGLLDLRAGAVVSNLALNLLLHVEILHKRCPSHIWPRGRW